MNENVQELVGTAASATSAAALGWSTTIAASEFEELSARMVAKHGLVQAKAVMDAAVNMHQTGLLSLDASVTTVSALMQERPQVVEVAPYVPNRAARRKAAK